MKMKKNMDLNESVQRGILKFYTKTKNLCKKDFESKKRSCGSVAFIAESARITFDGPLF